jgi:protein involved in polysaccharide export with SLBB domain
MPRVPLEKRLPMLRLATTTILAVLATVSVSCSVTPPGQVNEIYKEVLLERHTNYKLKPGDRITIRLYNRAGDLNQTEVNILPDGRCDLFFMDNMKIEGKTIPQVEAELKARIADQVRDAEVSILITPYLERVHFVGQFERPGTVDLTVKMTLQEAISTSLGTRITGDTDYALLRRPYMNPRHPHRYRIDLNDESEEIFLLPGDQIILERNFAAGVINYLREFIFGVIPVNSLPMGSMGLAAL